MFHVMSVVSFQHKNNTAAVSVSLIVMEIADLRSQLKKAQKKASKAAEKNSNSLSDLEQQLQTQQSENRELENTNKGMY